eukprot:m.187740 g.187740  ORF g.187740 m.187740 type:complete len:52 (+) comp53581_c0_seq4:709-864(+)
MTQDLTQCHPQNSLANATRSVSSPGTAAWSARRREFDCPPQRWSMQRDAIR